jgi:hypothetical protein
MNTIIERQAPKLASPNPGAPKPKKRQVWFIWLLLIVVIYAASSLDEFPFLIEKDGAYDLSPQRKSKLQKELDEIDEAVQYVIYASKAGFYPCYHGTSGTIFLNPGEIWKYGTTRIGFERRYGVKKLHQDLVYMPEFFGDYATCLKLEK